MKRQELIDKWLEALESGEYKQGKRELATETPNGEFRFCCLGVVCVEAGIEKDLLIGLSYLPEKIAKKLGIEDGGSFIVGVTHRGRRYKNLASMNDAGVRFKTIARIIRENLENKNFEKP